MILIAILLAMLFRPSSSQTSPQSALRREAHALWAHPADAGTSIAAEKLTRSIEAARKAQPDGIALFAAGNVTREKLWPTLEAAFKE